MRQYWRSSYFVYEVIDDAHTPLIVYWRATVFTFARPVGRGTLRGILEEYAEEELIEARPKSEAYEAEQVDASEAHGLGFNWVEVSRSEQRGRKLIKSDERIDVFQLQAWEKIDTRLGPSKWMEAISIYGQDVKLWESIGRAALGFWRWLTLSGALG